MPIRTLLDACLDQAAGQPGAGAVWRVWNDAVGAMESLLERPRFVESVRIAPYKDRGTEVDVVLDLMIHDIDLVQFIAGSPKTPTAPLPPTTRARAA